MLGLVDLKETRVYQETRAEALEEGREEGAKKLVLRLLTRKFGDLPEELQAQVSQLSLEKVEALGEALFDIDAIADLRNWLNQQDGE